MESPDDVENRGNPSPQACSEVRLRRACARCEPQAPVGLVVSRVFLLVLGEAREPPISVPAFQPRTERGTREVSDRKMQTVRARPIIPQTAYSAVCVSGSDCCSRHRPSGAGGLSFLFVRVHRLKLCDQLFVLGMVPEHGEVGVLLHVGEIFPAGGERLAQRGQRVGMCFRRAVDCSVVSSSFSALIAAAQRL